MATTTESKIEDFAEELEKVLGTAKAKAEDWLGQREQIAKTLAGIRDTATGLLEQLTGGSADLAVAVRRARRGRPPGSGRKRGPARPPGTGKPGRPKGRTMSAAARKKISDAQKARWARQKAGEKKK
jgi:hypothetical protein